MSVPASAILRGDVIKGKVVEEVAKGRTLVAVKYDDGTGDLFRRNATVKLAN